MSISAISLEPVQLNQRDAAAFLSISPRLLDQLVRERKILPIRIPGVRRVAFRVDELRVIAESWRAARDAR